MFNELCRDLKLVERLTKRDIRFLRRDLISVFYFLDTYLELGKLNILIELKKLEIDPQSIKKPVRVSLTRTQEIPFFTKKHILIGKHILEKYSVEEIAWAIDSINLAFGYEIDESSIEWKLPLGDGGPIPIRKKRSPPPTPSPIKPIEGRHDIE